LLQRAEALKEQGNARTAIYGLMTGELGFSALVTELEQAGVNPFALPLDQVNLDQPPISAALDRVWEMAETRTIWHPRMWDQSEPPMPVNIPQAVADLASNQQLAIWSAAYYPLTGGASSAPFEIGFAPMPDGSLPYYLPGQAGYIISAGTLHPEAAGRWLSFLSRQALPIIDNLQVNEVPARRTVAEQIDVWRTKDEALTAALQTALEQPTRMTPVTHTPVWLALRSAWERVMNGQEAADQAVLSAQTEIVEALDEAQSAAANQEPIVVATPVVLPAGVTLIRYGDNISPEAPEPLIEQFTKEHPNIRVEFTNINAEVGPNSVTEFRKSAAQVDCFRWPTPPNSSIMNETLDLRPFMEADQTFEQQDFPPALLQRFQVGTGTYGLPIYMQFRALVYNETLFQAAGVSAPQPNMTFDDFFALAQEMTNRDGGAQRYGYGQTNGGPRDVRFFLDQFNASTGRAAAAGMEPDFTNPAVVRAVSTYVMLMRDFSPQPELPGYVPGPELDVIDAGNVAMWLSYYTDGLGFRALPPTGQIAPRLIAPPRNSATAGINDVRVDGMYISAHTEHAQACWTWLNYLSRSALSVPQGQFPARRSVADSEAFRAKLSPDALELYTSYLPALDQPPASLPQDMFTDPQFDPYWLYRAIDRAMQGGDLEEELLTAQNLTSAYLACVRAGGDPRECAVQIDPEYQGRGPVGLL
jgi:multiple sugar transport system substrate-binding protein